jgi:Rrf2 family iron-sulfur cluster assembly transcriptional regulator
VDATKCQGQGNCQQGETCLTHHLWQDLSEQIHDFLSGISLADLIARNDIKRIALQQDQRREMLSQPELDGARIAATFLQ